MAAAGVRVVPSSLTRHLGPRPARRVDPGAWPVYFVRTRGNTAVHTSWSGLECYLAELYVVPDRRHRGLGRALMEGAIELARHEGADYMLLGTREDDTAARRLYESLGFSNREGGPDGPISYYYERGL